MELSYLGRDLLSCVNRYFKGHLANIVSFHYLIVIFLMAAQVICAVMSSTASTDTNRDIFFALAISKGYEYPLTGPEINRIFHLSPLWFYVLSPAIWLVPNAAAVTGLMALIGSLQFPLAYKLASKLADARCAILFVLALAMPGIMAVSLVSLTHTIAVIPCLLLLAISVLKYRERQSAISAFLIGIVSAACLNAHPTTILLVGVGVLWGAFRAKQVKDLVIYAIFVTSPAIISFLPMIYAQAQGGFADVSSSLQYSHKGFALSSPFAAVTLIWAVLYNGPKYMLNIWLDAPPVYSGVALTIISLLLVSSVVGLVWRLRGPRNNRVIIYVLFCLLLVQSQFTSLIRIDMPPWMAYAQWPIASALIAIGLDSVSRVGILTRSLVVAGLSFTTLLSLSIWVSMAVGRTEFVEMGADSGKLPFQGDIRQYSNSHIFFRMPRIPFRQDLAIGKLLCEPSTLFGHYAYFVDISYGAGALSYCGGRENVRLGGAFDPARRNLVGLREEVWKSIGIEPAQKIGVLGISVPSSVWTAAVSLNPETPYLSTFPHKLSGTVKRFFAEGHAAKDEAVLISHRAHRYLPFTVISASANGISISPSYSDLLTYAYRLPQDFAGKDIHWQFEIEGAAEYVDVFTITK